MNWRDNVATAQELVESEFGKCFPTKIQFSELERFCEVEDVVVLIQNEKEWDALGYPDYNMPTNLKKGIPYFVMADIYESGSPWWCQLGKLYVHDEIWGSLENDPTFYYVHYSDDVPLGLEELI